MRLLILLILLYLGYRFLKSWIVKETPSQKATFGTETAESDNVMVKDPYCGIFFAQNDGVHLRVNDQDLYFCSQECKDKFLEKQAKG